MISSCALLGLEEEDADTMASESTSAFHHGDGGHLEIRVYKKRWGLHLPLLNVFQIYF